MATDSAISPAIAEFRIGGFKCFSSDVKVRVAPVTLLFGPNNSGKSSLIEGMFLPSHTLRSEDPRICLRMVSPEHDFGSFSDIAHKHADCGVVRFGFSILGGRPNDSGDGPDQRTDLDFSVGYMPQRKETYLEEVVLRDSSGFSLRILTTDRYSGRIRIEADGIDDLDRANRLARRTNFVYRFDLFYEQYKRMKRACGSQRADALYQYLSRYTESMWHILDAVRNVFYLGPLRLPPARSYSYSGEVPQWVGSRGQNALQIYATLKNRRDNEAKRVASAIDGDLAKLGFMDQVRVVSATGSRTFELWTRNSESGLSANLADTGFGASQIIPVVVAIHASPENATILVEQPELHLHPAAQAELGSIFANAAGLYPQKRFVLETHSENLILRLQQETLNPDLRFPLSALSVNYVNPARGGHEVMELELGDDASFKTPWPRGFFTESYEESMKLAQARMRHADDA